MVLLAEDDNVGTVDVDCDTAALGSTSPPSSEGNSSGNSCTPLLVLIPPPLATELVGLLELLLADHTLFDECDDCKKKLLFVLESGDVGSEFEPEVIVEIDGAVPDLELAFDVSTLLLLIEVEDEVVVVLVVHPLSPQASPDWLTEPFDVLFV